MSIIRVVRNTALTTAAIAVTTVGLSLAAPTPADAGIRLTPGGRVVVTCEKGDRVPGSIRKCKPGHRYVYVAKGTKTGPGSVAGGPHWVRVR